MPAELERPAPTADPSGAGGRRVLPLLALGVLSVAMWSSRIRNVVDDPDLAGTGQAARVALALVFVAGGSALLAALAAGRGRPDPLPRWGRAVAGGLAGWTVVVWLVQGSGILVDPAHDAGFKVVHTVLAVASLGVAAWAARALGRLAPR